MLNYKTPDKNVPLGIYLGSGSKLKKQAVQTVIDKLQLHAYVYPLTQAISNVNEQPVGKTEILQGALNRLVSAYSLYPEGEIYIAIENGIEQDELLQWLDYAIVMLFIPKYQIFTYKTTEAIVFPTEYVEQTLNKQGGFKLNTVGKTLKEVGLVTFSDDPHLDLVGTSRKSILANTIEQLILQIPEYYFN